MTTCLNAIKETQKNDYAFSGISGEIRFLVDLVMCEILVNKECMSVILIPQNMKLHKNIDVRSAKFKQK